MSVTPPAGPRGVAASPVAFLMAVTFANWLGFAGWQALLNNFAREAAGFTGREVGFLHSVREIPGFLGFTAILWIVFLREQAFAYANLVLLGFGIALTGFFPSVPGLLVTTFIMSTGFHYFEAMHQSLSLQLLSKDEAPRQLGRIAGAAAVAQLLAFGGMALAWQALPDFATLFAVAGCATVILTGAAWLSFRRFDGTVPQTKGFVLRQRYWLFYALNFMSGARRQIFVAFGGFLLVERFGYDVTTIALLLLATYAVNTVAGPALGALVGRIGERATILIENMTLVLVFAGYALASLGTFGEAGGLVAGLLFIVDGVFSTLTIAQRTYFQKIADPADIAPTSAVSFTINHIAAVLLPVTFGLIWTKDPSLVFAIGAVIAALSLGLACLVPRHPEAGHETVLRPGTRPLPAE